MSEKSRQTRYCRNAETDYGGRVTLGLSCFEPEHAFARPPHLQYGGLAAWFTQPAGAVIQVVQPVRGTVELASWIVDTAYPKLEEQFPAPEKLTLILDLSWMNGRSAAARSVFLSKAREVAHRFESGYVVPPRAVAPAHLQAIQVGAAMIRALGVQVELVDCAARIIAATGLRAI